MRILIAEDETELARAMTKVLTMKEGHDVIAVENGQEAVDKAATTPFDMMIFDIMMPVMDGLTAVRTIRASGNNTPVLFLTAKSEVDDKIEGLDAGGDDYITKPFAMKELLARIRAVSRRLDSNKPAFLSVGHVVYNVKEQELKSENAIRLSGNEANLMEYMMAHAERHISVEDIFTHVWPKEDPARAESLVTIYVSYLNAKLEAIGADVKIREEDGLYTIGAMQG